MMYSTLLNLVQKRSNKTKNTKTTPQVMADDTSATKHLISTSFSSNKAVAISNNDVAFVAWKYNQKIPNCLGFAVYRTDLNSGTTIPLPAWVGFQGQSNANWQPQTTEVWPIQKFNWRDLTVKKGGFYQYKIVPMMGSVGKLEPQNDLAVTSNQVHLSPDHGNIFTYFNRGILSTQSLAHQIPQGPSGEPDYKVLTNRIDQPGDPLRQSLAGDSISALKSLLERAKTQGGQCYGALYELSDTDLEQELIGSPFVHLVLSNTGTDDQENAPARQALHESNVDVYDRMLGSGHIGHNKSMVYLDSNKTPQAVLTGSTNWTPTGLCAQSNNAMIIESADVATLYYDYWNRLKEDTLDANGNSNQLQSAGFRQYNNESHKFTMPDGVTNITVWFSPNTKSKTKGPNSPTPSDMQEVFDVMSSAQQAILFLAFQPGTPSIVDQAAECQNKNSDLFVRGAVTDPKAVDQFKTDLFHRSGDKPDGTVKDIVPASQITDQFSFWQKELLKASPGAHAIIHDKIVVVDPFSPNCAVITGSHNLRYRASYNNDENLVIIRGNRAVAESYAAHVLDVYDHYRWRYWIQNSGKKVWTGLQTDDSWEDTYFDPTSDAQKDFKFWSDA
jgi:phosphatidylserine/phosphatidylglycerophosphate/cardiolipin synthase-like enzyme